MHQSHALSDLLPLLPLQGCTTFGKCSPMSGLSKGFLLRGWLLLTMPLHRHAHHLLPQHQTVPTSFIFVIQNFIINYISLSYDQCFTGNIADTAFIFLDLTHHFCIFGRASFSLVPEILIPSECKIPSSRKSLSPPLRCYLLSHLVPQMQRLVFQLSHFGRFFVRFIRISEQVQHPVNYHAMKLFFKSSIERRCVFSYSVHTNEDISRNLSSLHIIES